MQAVSSPTASSAAVQLIVSGQGKGGQGQGPGQGFATLLAALSGQEGLQQAIPGVSVFGQTAGGLLDLSLIEEGNIAAGDQPAAADVDLHAVIEALQIVETADVPVIAAAAGAPTVQVEAPGVSSEVALAVDGIEGVYGPKTAQVVLVDATAQQQSSMKDAAVAASFASISADTAEAPVASAPRAVAGVQQPVPEVPGAIPQAAAIEQPRMPVVAETAAPGAGAMKPSAPVHTQVVEGIIKAQAASGGRITIQLNPHELGKVEVTLVKGDGQHVAKVVVERAETMDLVRSELRQLERALAEAGMDVRAGSVSVALRGGGSEESMAGGDDASGDGRGAQAAFQREEAISQVQVGPRRLADGRGSKLNITV